MDKPAASAESIFVRAIELTPGNARDEFVAAQCAGVAAVRADVDSLLRAHDQAGTFLHSKKDLKETRAQSTPLLAAHGTAVMNAAAHAEAFLRGAASGEKDEVDAFVAALPEQLRPET